MKMLLLIMIIEQKNKNIIGILVILFLALFLLPIRKIEWGKLRWLQSETVTVTGEAKSVQKNQIASFTAGVTSLKDNKAVAVEEVNTKMAALVKSIKDFGIDDNDIKTQNINVYQENEAYLDSGVSRTKKGQWRVNNSVRIVLKDVSKAGSLTDLLTASGATEVNGPSFSFEDTNSAEKDLFAAAVKDAKEKAELLAKAAERKLGKVVTISEGSGGVNYPIMSAKADSFAGAGAVVEPGSTSISKSLTVVFELK